MDTSNSRGHTKPLSDNSDVGQDSLPCHGRIDCALCHSRVPVFNRTSTIAADGNWRLTANPMAWGNPHPEVLILGFSKGPNQIQDIETRSHNDIAFRKGRANVGKILAHVGLIPSGTNDDLRKAVDQAIADENGRFGWGSLIRCTVERHEPKKSKWVATSKMIDPFLNSQFGSDIASRCATRFLRDLPGETRLIVMFGLGTKLGYVSSAQAAIERARPGRWRSINDVAYSDGLITVVHVEHFKAQGSLIPDWLGEKEKPRATYGKQAKAAVKEALRPSHASL